MNIPVIDIAGFRSGSESERRRLATQIDTEARHVGFMQIVGHGVPDAVVRGLADAIEVFFDLAQTDKAKFNICAPASAFPGVGLVRVADHIAAKLGGSRGLALNPGGEREAARLMRPF